VIIEDVTTDSRWPHDHRDLAARYGLRSAWSEPLITEDGGVLGTFGTYCAYKKLEMPVIGVGATGYGWLQASVTPKATHFRLVKVENSGHFPQEEQPKFVAKPLSEFFTN